MTNGLWKAAGNRIMRHVELLQLEQRTDLYGYICQFITAKTELLKAGEKTEFWGDRRQSE